MTDYFWDTGIVVAYCHYPKTLPSGMSYEELDKFSVSAEKFVNETPNSKHVISKETKKEMNNKMLERRKAVEKLLFLNGKKIKRFDLFQMQLNSRGDEWVDEKSKLFKKYDKNELTNLFTNLLAILSVRLDYLLNNKLEIHNDFDWDTYTNLKNYTHGSDARILAYAIKYNNNHKIDFITTDTGFDTLRKEDIKNIDIPSIIMMWEWKNENTD